MDFSHRLSGRPAAGPDMLRLDIEDDGIELGTIVNIARVADDVSYPPDNVNQEDISDLQHWKRPTVSDCVLLVSSVVLRSSGLWVAACPWGVDICPVLEPCQTPWVEAKLLI